MYRQFSLTPGYASHNWLVPPFYSLPHDLLYPPNMILRDPPASNTPVFVSMIAEPTTLTLQFSPDLMNSGELAQRPQRLQHKMHSFQPPSLVARPQPMLKFHQRLHQTSIKPKMRSNLQRLKKSNAIRCEICKVTLNSRLQASQHFNGKNHMRVVNKMEKTKSESDKTECLESAEKNICSAESSTHEVPMEDSSNDCNSRNSEKEIFNSGNSANSTDSFTERSLHFFDPHVSKGKQRSFSNTSTTKPPTSHTPCSATLTSVYPATTSTTVSTPPPPTTTTTAPDVSREAVNRPSPSLLTKPDADSTIEENEEDDYDDDGAK